MFHVKLLPEIFKAKVVSDESVPPAEMIGDEQYGFIRVIIINFYNYPLEIFLQHPGGVEPEKENVKWDMSGSYYGQNNLCIATIRIKNTSW